MVQSLEKRVSALEEKLFFLQKDYYDVEERVHLPPSKRKRLGAKYKRELKYYEKQKPTGWAHAMLLHYKIPELKGLIKRAEKDKLTDRDLGQF